MSPNYLKMLISACAANHAFVVADLRRVSNFGGAFRSAGRPGCEVVPVDLTSNFFGFFFTVFSSAF